MTQYRSNSARVGTAGSSVVAVCEATSETGAGVWAATTAADATSNGATRSTRRCMKSDPRGLTDARSLQCADHCQSASQCSRSEKDPEGILRRRDDIRSQTKRKGFAGLRFGC